MNISVKQLKETETKVHEKLNDNLKYLTYLHPASKDFEEIFKKNMFVKSNKSAFQQVMYYLFTVFDSNLTQQRITSWPLYDVKREGLFRNEVMAYINFINNEYENANLPNLMTSHLVTPGGYKIAKFLLKFSNFIIYEYLKKNSELEILAPIKPNSDSTITNIILKNLKTITAVEEEKLRMIYQKFYKTFEEATQQASVITEEQKQINEDIRETIKTLARKQDEMKSSGTCNVSNELITDLETNVLKLEEVKNLCGLGITLLTYLLTDKLTLKFDLINVSKYLKVDNNELSLTYLFDSLDGLLKDLEIPIFTKNYLKDKFHSISEINEKYQFLKEKLTIERNDLIELCENGVEDVHEVSK